MRIIHEHLRYLPYTLFSVASWDITAKCVQPWSQRFVSVRHVLWTIKFHGADNLAIKWYQVEKIVAFKCICVHVHTCRLIYSIHELWIRHLWTLNFKFLELFGNHMHTKIVYLTFHELGSSNELRYYSE